MARQLLINWRLYVFCSILLFGSALLPRTNSSNNGRRIKSVYTKIGASTILQWNSYRNKTIDYCRWDRLPEVNKRSLLSVISTEKNLTSSSKYSINLNGLQDGYCQLSISNVQLEDLSLWNCTTIDKEGGENALGLGTVNLSHIVKPSSPTISKSLLENLLDSNNREANNTVNIVCCADGGSPAAKLKIVIDNVSVHETPFFPQDEPYSEEKLCLVVNNLTLDWTYHSRYIECLAEHNGYEDSDVQEDSFLLNIYHEPRVITTLANESNVELSVGTSTTEPSIIVEFSANPFPEIHWLWKDEDGRYKKLPPYFQYDFVQNLKNRSWEAVLVFKRSEMKIYEYFLLTLKNKYGYIQINVIVQKEQSQYTTWPWILIYLGGALALITTGILLFFAIAREKGVLCFQNRVGQFKPEVQYTESQQDEFVPDGKGNTLLRGHEYSDSTMGSGKKADMKPDSTTL